MSVRYFIIHVLALVLNNHSLAAVENVIYRKKNYFDIICFKIPAKQNSSNMCKVQFTKPENIEPLLVTYCIIIYTIVFCYFRVSSSKL